MCQSQGDWQRPANYKFRPGVIDPQRLLEQSRIGKRALYELKDYLDRREKPLLLDEEELRSLEKALKRDRRLSDAQKREKQEQFRSKAQNYQRRVEVFSRELTGRQKQLVDQYLKRIAPAAKMMAEKNGFTLIVDKGS